MTSRLPPRRRDTRSIADRVRQDRENLNQLYVGFMGGRYPPLRRLGSPALLGDLEDDTATESDDLLRFVNDDSATWSGAGDLVIGLSHVPWSDSLQVKLNGHELEPADWTYSASLNTVTIPAQTWWEADEETGTAYYSYFGDDDPSEPADSAYDAAVLSQPTLLGYWRLAESVGPVMVDSSGHGHHGTYTADVALGATALLTGDPDTSADFPPAGSESAPRGVVPFGAWMNVPTFSIECWMATDPAHTGIGYMVDRDTNARSWLLRVESGGDNVGFQNIGGTAVVGTATMTDHARHYVAATYDGTTARLYVDGSLVQSGASSGPPSVAADLAVGATYAGDSTWWVPYYFGGRLGKVAFYSGAQSAADILGRWQIGAGETS